MGAQWDHSGVAVGVPDSPNMACRVRVRKIIVLMAKPTSAIAVGGRFSMGNSGSRKFQNTPRINAIK